MGAFDLNSVFCAFCAFLWLTFSGELIGEGVDY